MTRMSGETLLTRLGWCPSAHGMRGGYPSAGKTAVQSAEPLPDQPPPGVTPAAAIRIPNWFTAVSIITLAATPLVGGNLWWLVIVLAITAIGIAAVWHANRPSRRS